MERDNLLRRSPTVKRSKLPLNRLYFFVALLLFIVVLIIGFRFSGAHNDLQNRAEWALSLSDAALREQGTNHLLYGFYEKGGSMLLEDIFLINYPPDMESPHIIFIPGEMLFNRQVESLEISSLENSDEIPGNEENNLGTNERINTFYFPVHFYKEGGAKLLIDQLSYFLGVPVHYYLELNYEGIPEMVDYRGGITYRGYDLDGDDYYDYFLQGERDELPLGRALRRMQSLSSLVEYVGEKRGVFSKSRSVRRAAPYIDTNMTWDELDNFYVSLAPLFSDQENNLKDNVIEVPGVWREHIDGDTYFEPNNELISYMMTNLGKEFILPRELITVAVLNGSGVAGIAAQVAELLEEKGFQVVDVDNADSFDYPRSQVISRQDGMEPAREVAVVIPGSELLKEPVEGSPAMVTVIVGKNFTLD